MNLRNKTIILLIAFSSIAQFCAKAQSYKPVSGKMTTEWGDRVTPENVWREYPRPQLKRDEWKNLNGLWEYAITTKDASAPDAYEGKILVPFAIESTLSGVGKAVMPDQKVWYRTTFDTPDSWK